MQFYANIIMHVAHKHVAVTIYCVCATKPTSESNPAKSSSAPFAVAGSLESSMSSIKNRLPPHFQSCEEFSSNIIR